MELDSLDTYLSLLPSVKLSSLAARPLFAFPQSVSQDAIWVGLHWASSDRLRASSLDTLAFNTYRRSKQVTDQTRKRQTEVNGSSSSAREATASAEDSRSDPSLFSGYFIGLNHLSSAGDPMGKQDLLNTRRAFGYF